MTMSCKTCLASDRAFAANVTTPTAARSERRADCGGRIDSNSNGNHNCKNNCKNNKNGRSQPQPQSQQPPKQIIAVFDNQHYVIETDGGRSNSNSNNTNAMILDTISALTGWPVSFLAIARRLDEDYVILRSTCRILGGKGGFGSLLKSQSRQAGAHATTNFGACRDLQGRRLRHVNDAVAAAHAQEWHEKLTAGQATNVDRAQAVLLGTESRIPGWYLALPAWSDVSKKEFRKWQRQFHKWKQEQDELQREKDEKKRQTEARVQHYVETATQAAQTARASLKAALQQGLAKQQQQSLKQKQQREWNANVDDDPDNLTPSSSNNKKNKRLKQQPEPPTALLTLSGDIVLAYENDHWQVQSQSNFGTFGIVLQWDLLREIVANEAAATTTTTSSTATTTNPTLLYWEVQLITGGLSQIGWAASDAQRFQPNSETGDGVGDDAASYAYDGSRGICLHDSQTRPYGDNTSSRSTSSSSSSSHTCWKAGDVVGCCYDYTHGTLSFSRNGKDCGVAFTVPPASSLFPAASCNPHEILELHFHDVDMKFRPAAAIAIARIMATEAPMRILDDENEYQNDNDDNKIKEEKKKENDGKKIKEEKEEENSERIRISKDNETQQQQHDKEPNALSVPKGPEEESKTTTTAGNTCPPPVVAVLSPAELEQIQSVTELEALGLDCLKETLRSLGVKCGGTLQQRAERLFSLKGLAPTEYPEKLLAHNKKKK